MTLTASEVRSTDFPAASRLRRGYAADDVDAFVERIAVRLETGSGLSSNDVYHAPLAKARIGERGYAGAEVDAFLERVHAELVEIEDAWGPQAAAPAQADDDAGTDTDAAPGGEPISADELPADGEALAEIAIPDPEPGPDPAGGEPISADELPADGEALAEIAIPDPEPGPDPAGAAADTERPGGC